MIQYRAARTALHRVGAWALASIAVVALTTGAGVVAATPAGAVVPAVTATPNTGLVDGQTIRVDGSGWQASHRIRVLECQIDAVTLCEFAGPTVTTDASGSFSLSLVVTRQFGPVDCAAPPSPCAVLALDTDAIPTLATVDLSFAGAVVVRPGGAVVAEGNSGTTNLLVPLTLSSPSPQTITVQWRTASLPGPPPHADPATDFTVTSGVVTFAPGETAKTVTISVNGDTLVEPDEWIVVGFNHPTNAKMGGFWGLGFGVILNDD
jgi:hypothetical protein